MSTAKVESFPADLFLDFVCLVEQLLVEVLALDPDEGLDGLADQLAVGFQLLGLSSQLLVPGARWLVKCSARWSLIIDICIAFTMEIWGLCGVVMNP